MKAVLLSRGRAIATVDDEDFDRVVSAGTWCVRRFTHGARTYQYGYRKSRAPNGSRKTVFLHRFIMSAPDDLVVDHIDCDGLNNIRKNLRCCSPLENTLNGRSAVGSTSRYRGVYLSKGRDKWAAKLRRRHLGTFATEDEAARIYDEAARASYGQYARLNFPKDGEQSAVA